MNIWQSILRKYPRISNLEMDILRMKYPLSYIHHYFVMTWADKVIHVIGDSHVQAFALQTPFIIHHCGPATAYNLCNQNSSTQSWLKLVNLLESIKKSKRDDIILFAFGEIDARIHIYLKSKQNGKNVSDLVVETVLRYGEVIRNVQSAGYKVAVLGITPASRQKKNHFNFEYYGLPDERSFISILLNQTLWSYCSKNNLKFIDLHKDYADSEGFIKPEYRKDDIHLNSKIVPYVRSEIYERFGSGITV